MNRTALAGESFKTRSPRARRQPILRRAAIEVLESRRYLTEIENPWPLGYTQTGGLYEGDSITFDLDFTESPYGVPPLFYVDSGAGWSSGFEQGIDFEPDGYVVHATAPIWDSVSSTQLKISIPDGDTEVWHFDPGIYSVAPAATLNSTGPINEGETVTISFTDPYDPSPTDTAAGFTYVFTDDPYGFGYETPSSTPSRTFTFTDDGPKTIWARIGDKDGHFGYADTTVTVANVAPFATYTITQADNTDTVTISLAGANDPSSTDTFKYSFSTVYDNLAQSYSAASSSSSQTFTEAQLANGAIGFARIFDDDGGVRNYSSGTTDMSAALVSSSQINLTWTDDVEDELGWRVQRSTNGTTFTDYVNLTAGTDFYEAMELDDGTRYWFRVRAYSGQGHVGESIYSPKMAQTTFLPTMENVTATNLDNADIIEVEWDARLRAASQDYDTFIVSIYREGEEPSASSLLASAQVDAVNTSHGAGAYSHRFIDLLHDGGFFVTVIAKDANNTTSAPPGPVSNKPEIGSNWLAVASLYDNDDLVDLGIVPEIWTDVQDQDYPGPYNLQRQSGDTATVIFKNLPKHTRAQLYNLEVITSEFTEGVGTFTVTASELPQHTLYQPPTVGLNQEYYIATTDAPLAVPMHSFGHSSRSLVVRITLDNLPEGVTWSVEELALNIWGPPLNLGKKQNEPPVPEDDDDFDAPPDDDPDYPDPIHDPDDPIDYNDVIYKPDEEDDEEEENQVNLIVGGWAGFRTSYGWPYAEPNFMDIYGSTEDPPGAGIPPEDESVFIGVNDDYDEGNTDEQGDPLPDNVADAHLGEQVDWDVAPMFMTIYSTLGDEQPLGTFSLTYPTDKVLLWRPNPDNSPGASNWVPMASGANFDIAAWQQLYGGGNWFAGKRMPFLVEGIASSDEAHDIAITASFTRGSPGTAEDTVRFTASQGDIDVDSDNDDTITDADDPIEADRELPGVSIPLNQDDDDEDDVPDYLEEGVVDGEDDLVPLIIRKPLGLSEGTLTLEIAAGAASVRAWEDEERSSEGPVLGEGAEDDQFEIDVSEMPSGGITLWLEGIAASALMAGVRFVLTMQLPGSASTSPVDAASGTVNGLQVLILKNGKREPGIPRVAKWENAYSASGDVLQDFISRDPDRFYVRLTDPTLRGSNRLVATISTDSPNPVYDDPASKIYLYETEAAGGGPSGVFESGSQILVSDAIDDAGPGEYGFPSGTAVYLIEDEHDPYPSAYQDRTHKIALGGKITVKVSPGADNPLGPATEWSFITPKVEKEKVLSRIKFIILNSATDKAGVLADIDYANERLAQLGIFIQIDPTNDITLLNAPPGVDLSDGLDVLNPINTELAALFDSLGSATQDDIVVFYANHFGVGSQTAGRAFVPSLLPTVGGRRINNIAMSVGKKSKMTLVHEIGHVLLNADHINVRSRMMWSHSAFAPPPGVVVTDAIAMENVGYYRRFTVAEEQTIKDPEEGGKFLDEPPP